MCHRVGKAVWLGRPTWRMLQALESHAKVVALIQSNRDPTQ